MDSIVPGRGMYRSKRLDQQRTSRTFVVFLIFSFAVIGWLWFLFGSGIWEVASIEISDLQSLDRGEVERELNHAMEQRPWRPWKKNNLIMMDTEKVASILKERLFAEDVAVEKSYPNILRLIIKERQRSVILVSNEQYVNVDASGVVTGDAVEGLLKASQDRVAARAFADDVHLPVIVMNTADPLSAGFQVAEPAQVRAWLDASRAMVLGGVKIRFMKVETPESSLGRFVSERGYDIYVDLEKNLDQQIATYQAFMRTKPDESLIKEHLDIRVPGRVFIK